MTAIFSATNEKLYVEGRSEGTCEIHDWDIDRVRRDFVRTLRERHGKGGLTICAPCVARLNEMFRAEREKEGRG